MESVADVTTEFKANVKRTNNSVKKTNNTINRKGNIGIYILLVIWSVVILLPLVWLLNSSLKEQTDLMSNVWGPPKKFLFSNFSIVWNESGMGRNMLNSILVCAVSVALTIVTSVPIAFVVSRFRFKFNKVIYFFVITGMMLPIQAAVIPIYIEAMKFHLTNNLVALSFIYAAFRVPFSVFILDGFMATIPKELEECAIIDGCGIWKIFTRIITPLSIDGIATISILTILSSWNEMLLSMLLVSSMTLKTLPVGLMGFVSEYSAQYTQLCAGLLIALVPGLVFYALAQDRIVKGLTAGAVKG